MASHRHDRLTEDIRRELTDIFRMLKDPRITGMISIVKVDLSGDQSYCKVYISSLDGLAAADRAVEGLKMRRTPEFHFISDDSIEYSADIARILYDLDK